MKSALRAICSLLLLFLGLLNAVLAADQAASKPPFVVAAASPAPHPQAHSQPRSAGASQSGQQGTSNRGTGTGSAGSTNYHPSNYHPSSYHAPSSNYQVTSPNYHGANSNYHPTSSNYHGTDSNYHSTNSTYHAAPAKYNSTNGNSAATSHTKSAIYNGENYHQANSHGVTGIVDGHISRRTDRSFYRDISSYHDARSTVRIRAEYARYPEHYHGYWGGGWYHGYFHEYWAYQPWVWYSGYYGFWLPVGGVNVFVRETEPGVCHYWNGDAWVSWWDPPYTPYYCPY
jgi:hypothetical protein